VKITLDHNCIIDLRNDTQIGKVVRSIVKSPANNCFVVNIGASEMRKEGVRPDKYEKFEQLLDKAGVAHLPRLNPMVIFDVTFFDHCILAGEEMIKLAEAIEDILFGDSEKLDITSVGLDSPEGEKWLNRLCNVHSLWCHIQNQNDVFLTADSNFKKKTKLAKLIALGAGGICHPNDL